MAFLRERGGSPYWYACFHVPAPSGGWKQVSKSTRILIHPPPAVSDKEAELLRSKGLSESDVKGLRGDGLNAAESRRLAQKVADSWEAASKKGWTAAHIRRVMGELTVDVTGDALVMPSVRCWCDEFLAGLPRKGKSVSTVRNYANAIKRFYSFLGGGADGALDQVTAKAMNDFVLWLADLFSVPTVRKEFVSVGACFSAAVKLGVLERNPAVGIELPKERLMDDECVSRRGFTVDELRSVLALCDDEWRSMVLCALYLGGQRLGDMAMLRWSAVDWERGVVEFRTIKTGRAMMVPVVPALRVHLDARMAVCAGEEFIHPSCAAEYKRRGGNRLSAIFSGVLFDAGLIERDPRRAGKIYKRQGVAREDKRRHKNAVSFHSLRYTVTTMLHDAGVVPAMVQEIVGHSSAKVHSGYIKFGAEATERALGNLPAL